MQQSHVPKWCIVFWSTVFWDLWDGSLIEIWWIQHEQWNIKLQVSIHLLANKIAIHLTQCSQGTFMVTKWSLFIKKITVAHQVKEQNYSLIMLFHKLDITLELPTKMCLWPKLCWCFWKWLSTKHISITLLTSWDHDPHRPSKIGRFPHGMSHHTLDKDLHCI